MWHQTFYFPDLISEDEECKYLSLYLAPIYKL